MIPPSLVAAAVSSLLFVVAAWGQGEPRQVYRDTVLLSTYKWDIESNQLRGTPNCDFWWQFASPTESYLVPVNGAKAAIVEAETFELVDAVGVRNIALSETKLPQKSLRPGTIVAFVTAEGGAGKLQVLGYKSSHDFNFPEAANLSESRRAWALGGTNIVECHLQVRSILLEPPKARAETATGRPRLCAIVNVGGIERAVIEGSRDEFGRTSLMTFLEHHARDGIEMIEINPASNKVIIRQIKNRLTSTLTLTNDAYNGTVHGLALENAPLEAVLDLYSLFLNRTLLCSPRLSRQPFTFLSLATTESGAAFELERLLGERGIAAIPDGDKFMILVTLEEAAAVTPGSSKLKIPSASSSELLPAGVINFPDTDVAQVLRIFAEMIGRKWDQNLPLSRSIGLRTQTSLTRAEAAYAIETVLGFAGVRIVRVGEDQMKAERSE